MNLEIGQVVNLRVPIDGRGKKKTKEDREGKIIGATDKLITVKHKNYIESYLKSDITVGDIKVSIKN